MAIDLREIWQASVDYIDTKVKLKFSSWKPAGGTLLANGENFTFTATAQNATPEIPGVAIENVVWHIKVLDDTVAKLIVPAQRPSTDPTKPTSFFAEADSVIARASMDSTTPLTSGTKVSEMYLFFTGDWNYLWAKGQERQITLKGVSEQTAKNGATTQIEGEIYGNISWSWIFSRQDSPKSSLPVPLKVEF